jgi:hypothetical protein
VFSPLWRVGRSLRHKIFNHLTIKAMNAQKSNSLKVLVQLTLLCGLLITASCQTKEGTAQGTKSAAKPSVKPPQIDIHTAVLTENVDAVRQHLAAGTNVNEKDPFGGSSPLISAALFGKTDMVKLLVESGADLNFKNNDGSTPLHVAAFFCRPEIVKILLDKGADKSITNNYGATAYQSVAGPFSEVKSAYDMMGKMLGPMGLKLDYPYLEKTRPEIAAMLK